MQIFPRSLNKLPLVAAVGSNLALVGVVFVFWYWLSPKNLVMGYAPIQPVPYSHRLHVGQLGMDCRYCHANIEHAAKAMIPPTQVCMGCHAVVKTDSAKLAPIRASWETGKAVEWVQVHRLPDHVFFDHSVHLHAAIGCVSCHGRVDEEEIIKVQKPLSMGWCLECHRDPTPNLRPKAEITNMTWTNDGSYTPPEFKPEGCPTHSLGREAEKPCVSPSDELLRVSSMSKRESYGLETNKDGMPVFWKSLEQKANPELTAQRATAEFPRDGATGSDIGLGPTGRRGFLFGGLSAALLAVEGCARRPVENILPFAKAPEYMLPGMPAHYATVRSHRGDAIGIVVENHDGRPTKIEGNGAHPHNPGGRTDVITQAVLLDLYDPDRSNGPRKGDKDATWAEFEAAVKAKVGSFEADGGARLRFLSPPATSPTFLALRDAVLQKLPHARFAFWTPVNESSAREGARVAFGQPYNVVYDYTQARVILALDSDFLGTEAGMIRSTWQFTASRKPGVGPQRGPMNRLYVVEPSYTTTGANADHRLRLPASQVGAYLLALGRELSGRMPTELASVTPAFASAPPKVDGVPAKWIKVVADELFENRGHSVITVGADQPPHVHAIAHALNRALGNTGAAVNYYAPTDAALPELTQDVKALVDEINAGKVDTLVVLGGNPAHDAPADLKFAEALAKVPTSIVLSHNVDETASKASWHVPRAHELETWGDVQGTDGSVAIQQPLIAPLFGGRSEIEILSLFTGTPETGHNLIQTAMKKVLGSQGQFEQVWKVALARGAVGGPAPRPVTPVPTVNASDVVAAIPRTPPAAGPSAQSLEIDFAPDPKLFDGRHANNPWLLELPDLMTKIVWDNAALVSPSTARALGLSSGDVVTLSHAGAQVEIPVWVMPGQADNVVTVNLGWGRQLAGRYAKDTGVNVYPLRTSTTLAFASGATLAKTGKTHLLAQTQEHQSMEGRPIAIDATLEEYKKTPKFAQYQTPDPKTLPLWKPVEYENHKWGMVIDLSACTGCDACVIACQAENNIATVGKDQVNRNREMYWIRIDRYFLGDDENEPQVALQPVACQQCEQAPCENVCPVNATTHSPEGLNDMAYNRCIGTRYCGNNCPYKVRRFNYLEFQGGPPGSSIDTVYGDLPETRKMQFNPDVTVRMRGVMEKCTYCVQRIQESKIASKRDDRQLRDGEIRTACEQACPAGAIVFGDLNNKNSMVARMTTVDRGYHLLSELGTHPRTTFLGKIRNPNPAMAEA